MAGALADEGIAGSMVDAQLEFSPSSRLTQILGALRAAEILVQPLTSVNIQDVVVRAIRYDSRRVSPGDAFFAIRGEKTDGHLYIEQAIRNGACAVFVEDSARFKASTDTMGPVPFFEVPSTRRAMAIAAAALCGNPSANGLALVGVTGTNGKTSTTTLLASILEAAGKPCGIIGTVEVRIAEERYRAERTTPEAPDLQELLGEMLRRGLEACAMEVSSHALALDRVAGCRFQTAIFTNLSQDHLDFHPSMEAYFDAKAALFTPSYTESAAVNISDKWGRRLLKRLEVPCVTFGREEDGAQVFADSVVCNRSSTAFVLHTKTGGMPFRRWDETGDGRASFDVSKNTGGDRERCALVEVPFAGSFAVWNCLAAAAGAVAMGIDFDAIVSGLEAALPVPGRFEVIDRGQDFLAVVDYAHTPDSLRAVLRSASALKGSREARTIVVIGCGGDRDRAKRPLMGRVAVEEADLAIFTSDNPRSEDPRSIIEQMVDGATSSSIGRDRFTVEVDREKAIHLAVSLARPGDIVVVAGKGHETGQVFKGTTVPFDDREVLGQALESMRPSDPASELRAW